MSLKNKHLSIYQRKNTSYSWKTPAQEIETQIISPNPSRVIQDTGQWRRERSLRKSVRPVSCRPGALPCWWPPEEGQGWGHTLSLAQGAVPGAVGRGVLAPDPQAQSSHAPDPQAQSSRISGLPMYALASASNRNCRGFY